MIALHRARALVATAATLAVEVGAVTALTALGSRRPFAVPVGRIGDWMQATPPADALAAALRWAALLGAWWLLGGTLLYVLAVAARVPGAVRAALRWAALPPVRRTVDAAFAATVAVGAFLAAASATATAARTDPPAPIVVRDGRGGGLASLPPVDAPPPTPPTPAPAPAPAPAPVVDTTVVVAPGDNLWELAARQVAATGRRARAEVTDAEIAPYWVVVCERNRAALASGDPNLLFPGEVVVLPALS